MKKLFLILGICFLMSGCGKNNDIVKNLKNKIESSNSYYIEGTLEIVNNENIYKYDIDVSYKKDDNFKVSLQNKTNDHRQIILKNSSGVYVLTPSLNKSFKFQSEWPYNNSESYLPSSVLEDILNDNSKKIDLKDNSYIITTKVNYPNNKELEKQKIYIDKEGNIKKIEVLDSKGIVKIKMNYEKIEYNKKFDKNYFDLKNNMNDKTEVTISNKVDTVYPMYMPENTYLDTKEVMSDGDRLILTFVGDNPFTIIEEVVKTDDNNITEVEGDIELLTDVIGYVDKGVASWISDGIEYYLVSDTMNDEELLKVVNSVSSIPVGK